MKLNPEHFLDERTRGWKVQKPLSLVAAGKSQPSAQKHYQVPLVQVGARFLCSASLALINGGQAHGSRAGSRPTTPVQKELKRLQ